MSDFGVDLTSKELLLLEAECDKSDLNRDTLYQKGTWRESPKEWQGRPFWELVSELTALDVNTPLESDRFASDVPESSIPPAKLPAFFSAEAHDSVAFAYPASLPPVVRRALPAILGAGLKTFFGVEAGVALVVEALGRRTDFDSVFPQAIATLTPVGSGHELALFDLDKRKEQAGPLPGLSASRHPSLFLTCQGMFELHESRWTDRLTQATREGPTMPRRLISLEGPSGKIADLVNAACGWPAPPLVLGEDAIARGAALRRTQAPTTNSLSG